MIAADDLKLASMLFLVQCCLNQNGVHFCTIFKRNYLESKINNFPDMHDHMTIQVISYKSALTSSNVSLQWSML